MEQRKKILLIGSVIVAVLWTGFALAFPMECYAVFFSPSSLAGSVLLLFLAGMLVTSLLLPLADIALKKNVHTTACAICNALLLTVFINVYSLMRYKMPALLALTAVVHLILMFILFDKTGNSSKKRGKSKKKGSKKGSDDRSEGRLYTLAVTAVFFCLSYFLYMLIFHVLLNVFLGNGSFD
ncbi:MAG: hypothetical protein J6F31_01040 [Oscillospiraceae bacterium]|nr:hypothetical protein [Oscillospiraceae bacterium]